jgi:hypothetical protein
MMQSNVLPAIVRGNKKPTKQSKNLIFSFVTAIVNLSLSLSLSLSSIPIFICSILALKIKCSLQIKRNAINDDTKRIADANNSVNAKVFY